MSNLSNQENELLPIDSTIFYNTRNSTTISFLIDFRKLNKKSKRHPFVFPIFDIKYLLMKLEGFQQKILLGLNMGYCHLELTIDSKKMCAVAFSSGKYKYQKLSIILCNSSDFMQEVMLNLFRDFVFVIEYIDDLLVTSIGTFVEGFLNQNKF